MSVFLYFEGLETRIGVLEGLVHVVWGESVSFNLCEYEVFCHFEQRLGHRGCPWYGGGKKNQVRHFYECSIAKSSAFLFSNCAIFLCKLRMAVCTFPNSVLAFLSCREPMPYCSLTRHSTSSRNNFRQGFP